MSRSKLPQRRANVTEWIWWPPPPENATKRIHITAGLVMDAAGALKVKECFIRGGSKVGHERDTLYDDLAVLLSRALQHGDTLEEIAAGLSGRNVASDKASRPNAGNRRNCCGRPFRSAPPFRYRIAVR